MTLADSISNEVRGEARRLYERLGRGSVADEEAIARCIQTALRNEREKCAKAAKNAALCLKGWPVSEEQADEIFAEVMRVA